MVRQKLDDIKSIDKLLSSLESLRTDKREDL
jgi:hypothetical protein